MKPKILILVCTSMLPPFDKFYAAQKETWDSVEHPDVKTAFYCGSGDNTWDGNLFRSDCPRGYYFQHWKHKLAIDAVWEWEWDLVFRTASSSYVNKKKLYEIAENLPKERLYGGYLLGDNESDVEWEGKMVKTECVSGAGVFYSRDVADILRKNIPEGENFEEDVLSGRILQSCGYGVTFVNKDRVDVVDIAFYNRSSYHYRFKTGDRMKDIENMYKIHEREIA